jgi:hypothetical protein
LESDTFGGDDKQEAHFAIFICGSWLTGESELFANRFEKVAYHITKVDESLAGGRRAAIAANKSKRRVRNRFAVKR